MPSIALRLEAVRTSAARAAERAGRDIASVRLVAVSKTQPAEAIAEAYEAGQRDFGENYVQELVAKAAALSDRAGLRWHAIGALQRNKARDVARLAHVVHTIDRSELAHELGRRAAAAARSLDVLVEVNVAGEAQKAGCAPGEVGVILDAIAAEAALRVVGLMTVPPAVEDPEAARPHFRAMRRLRDELQQARGVALPELSMGMSADFEIAIAEGATLVRVGTAIFGGRAPRG